MSLTKSQVKELRSLLKDACFKRDKGRCQKCGRQDTNSPAHIFPKGKYRNIEYDLDNLITLCYHHHILWAHRDPIGFTEWIKEKLGQEKFNRLKLRAETPRAMPRHYNTLKLYLLSELKKYENI